MPAKAGTTRPITAEDWLREANASSIHTSAGIADFLRAKQEEGEEGQHGPGAALPDRDALLEDGPFDGVPWDWNEELVFHQAKPSVFVELRVILRMLAMVGASAGLFMPLAQFVSSAMHAKGGSRFHKSKPSV